MSSVALLVLLGACSSPAQTGAPLPSCEWCGAAEVSAGVGASARLAPAGEPGIALEISGTVYGPDGKTPAVGVMIYAYHTNASGVYAKRGGETGNARRHGYLRGWVRTDAQGRYRFTTIRPAAYPGRSDPAHIHLTVTPPGGAESWIDSIEFDDDPLLTPAERARRRNTGGAGIVRLVTDARGVQHAVRDIILERGA